MREVAILGVGMHPFGAYYDGKTNVEMSLVAGLAALDDAGLSPDAWDVTDREIRVGDKVRNPGS